MKKLLFLIAAILPGLPMMSQRTATLDIHPAQGETIINRNIYGQFAEHLGTCIYGGLWVGEGSSIPNTNGYRNDVLSALKDLHIPVLRWPGDVLPMTIIGRTVSAPAASVLRRSIALGVVL